jgi:hypothetical protein
MTNYIHVIGAGHLTYFARHYGSLYSYSQQGWKSLNKLIEHQYYNNTNHGGSYGNGGKDAHGAYTKGTISGQHCLPLMRFCQHFMMWKLGYGNVFFKNILKETTLHKQPQETEFYNELTSENEEMQFGII